MPEVRAKFQVQEITKISWNKEAVEVKLVAVPTDDTEENKRFHQYTPSGELKIFIDNPGAAKHFELGRGCYLDFTFIESEEQ